MSEYDLSIGDVARRTGRTVHTLRWYEKEGLIPNVVRDAGGRRRYTERHVLWLELLGKLSATGMTIDEIRAYADLIRAGDETLEQRIELLSTHRETVEGKVEELRQALRLIDTKLEMYRRWVREGGSPVAAPELPVGDAEGARR